MTTDIRVTKAEQLFTKNDVMNLTQRNQAFTSPAAGASWVADVTAPYAGFLPVLKEVLALVEKKLPNSEFWLLIGTRAWQPNTRVVRYYKLWRALRARGFQLPSDIKSSEEVLIESKEGLKFFGGAKLSEFALADVAQILLKDDCTYIVALPRKSSTRTLLDLGWIGDIQDDAEIINHAIEINALLLKRVGEFDDSERGLVAIGAPSVVKALFD